jgi:hypothetical protein
LAIAPFLFFLSPRIQSVPNSQEHMGAQECFTCAFRAQDTFGDYPGSHDTQLHHCIDLSNLSEAIQNIYF